MKELKPCTKEEIEAFQKFAALSLEERRRRVYEYMVINMPNSPVTRDLLAGKIKLPKRRGRKKQQPGFKQRGRRTVQPKQLLFKFKQFEANERNELGIWRD